MSQVPAEGNGRSPNHAFWLSGIGGFVLGALTVILVLLLTRKTADRQEPGHEARPPQQPVQQQPVQQQPGQQ